MFQLRIYVRYSLNTVNISYYFESIMLLTVWIQYVIIFNVVITVTFQAMSKDLLRTSLTWP